MADSTESASALPYRLAVPSSNPTQPTQHMPHPTLLYPYYHPHYHLTLPYPSRAPTTTTDTPHTWQIPLNLPQPYPTTLLHLAQLLESPLNLCPSLLSCDPLDIPTTI